MFFLVLGKQDVDTAIHSIELRIENQKSRLNRRLMKLSTWVDIPESKREPAPESTQESLRTRVGERNIFIHDHNVQRGLLPQRGVGGGIAPSSFPHNINSMPIHINREPEALFRPMNLFQQANKIVSLQKKFIMDTISNQSSKTPPISTDSTPTNAAENSITVSLPVKSSP